MKEQRSTYSLYYYIDKRRMDSQKRCPVSIKITLNGTETTSSIHRKIHIENWIAEGGYPSGKTEEAKELKHYITTLNSKFQNVHKDLLQTETHITAQMLKANVFGMNKKNEYGILELFQQRIEKEERLYHNKVKSRCMYYRFKCTAEYLKDFLQEKYKLNDLSTRKMDDSFIEAFIEYLQLRSTKAKKKPGRLFSKNHINQCLQVFKSITTAAVKNKLMNDNPLDGISLRLDIEGKSIYLTQEELLKIIHVELKEEFLIHERDFFLFCCFTGISNCDFRDLKRINLEQANKKWWIRVHRNKTEVLSNIPLLPQAETILRKYQPDFENIPYDSLLFPMETLATRNNHLKEIAKLCGITKKVTTHVARHTFGTTVTLTNGVPLESVSKMLGHKSLRMTERYAKIVNAKIEKDTANLSGKLEAMLASAVC